MSSEPDKPKAQIETSKPLSAIEILGATACGFIAIFITTWISNKFIGTGGSLYMVASMGAASVLLFTQPNSSMSQPWALVGGHLVSSSAGVMAALLISDPALAAATAVALAIAGMLAFRCLHPPGGAAALGAVLGGDSVTSLGFYYVLTPVLFNAIVLLCLAVIINNLYPGRRYPRRRF